jgi:hypothetical protein
MKMCAPVRLSPTNKIPVMVVLYGFVIYDSTEQKYYGCEIKDKVSEVGQGCIEQKTESACCSVFTEQPNYRLHGDVFAQVVFHCIGGGFCTIVYT